MFPVQSTNKVQLLESLRILHIIPADRANSNRLLHLVKVITRSIVCDEEIECIACLLLFCDPLHNCDYIIEGVFCIESSQSLEVIPCSVVVRRLLQDPQHIVKFCVDRLRRPLQSMQSTPATFS